MNRSNRISRYVVVLFLTIGCGHRDPTGSNTTPINGGKLDPSSATASKESGRGHGVPSRVDPSVADASVPGDTPRAEASMADASVPAEPSAPVISEPTTPRSAPLSDERIEAQARDLETKLGLLRDQGFSSVAQIIEKRVKQQRRKMKLEVFEGVNLATEILRLLPGLAECRKLLPLMPKATVELVRSVAERGISPIEAEQMASYLYALHEALAMENPAPFDENCSHVIGREWHEIDYRGEGMTWENQKRIYVPKGILHFRDVDNLRRFFAVESKVPYFQKLYRPKGNGL